MSWPEVPPALLLTTGEFVEAIAVSRDGLKMVIAYYFTGTGFYSIRRYTRAAGVWGSAELLRTTSGSVEENGYENLAISADGQKIAVSVRPNATDANGIVICLTDSTLVQTISGSQNGGGMAMSGDGTVVVSWFNNGLPADVVTFEGSWGSLADNGNSFSRGLPSSWRNVLAITEDGLHLLLIDSGVGRTRYYNRAAAGDPWSQDAGSPYIPSGSTASWVGLSANASVYELGLDSYVGAAPAYTYDASAAVPGGFSEIVGALNGNGTTMVVSMDDASITYVRTYGLESGPPGPPPGPPPPPPTIASTPLIKRGSLRSVINVEVDSLDVTLMTNSETLVNNQPLTQFAREGGFDGARLTVERHFSASPRSESCGSLNLFIGRVSELSVTGSEVRMMCKSDLEILDVEMPRNIYQAPCIHTLYGEGCNLSAANFTISGNVTAGSSRTLINSNLAQADNYFNLGTVYLTSGANAGQMRSVKSYTTGVAVLSFPLPYVPAAGDLFDTRPGCDKRFVTCNSPPFNNALNHRGYPFIPVPEASM